MRGNKDTLNVATYHVAALQLRKSKKMSEKIFQSKKGDRSHPFHEHKSSDRKYVSEIPHDAAG